MNTLSSWWAKGYHRTIVTTDDIVIRLAVALSPVRSVVRVIDRSQPPMQVDWHTTAENVALSSYTDMRKGLIRINPSPIKDGRLDPADALDVCIGFAMHEASHSQESRSRYEVLLREVNGKRVPAFESERVAAYLWNLAEDPRIEAVTSRNWPGFAPYFTRLVKWLDDEFIFNSAPGREPILEYGPDLVAKLRFAYVVCRLPDRAAPLVTPDRAEEYAWWSKWLDDYLSDRADTSTTIQSALDHLGEDEETQQELAAMAAEEAASRQDYNDLMSWLDQVIGQAIPGLPESCDMPSDFLSAEESERVNDMVREHLEVGSEIVPADGASRPQILIRRPEETRESRSAYVGRPNAQTEALRAALVFRNSVPQWDEKLLRSGSIDDEELYRWVQGDHRVFSAHVVESKPDALLGLLVDLSGSMYGSKLDIAQRLAQLFVWGLHDQEGIETRVWGHTADVDRSGDAHFYRIWEPGDPLTRLGLISSLPHSSNADGHAIAWCASQMIDAPQPQKVLIVLSDGLPSASCYGRTAAHGHVRAVGRWADQRGVKVIQIAIDPTNIRPQDQEAMFPGSWMPFTSDAALPRQLSQLMARYA